MPVLSAPSSLSVRLVAALTPLSVPPVLTGSTLLTPPAPLAPAALHGALPVTPLPVKPIDLMEWLPTRVASQLPPAIPGANPATKIDPAAAWSVWMASPSPLTETASHARVIVEPAKMEIEPTANPALLDPSSTLPTIPVPHAQAPASPA